LKTFLVELLVRELLLPIRIKKHMGQRIIV
jgi:hypothetical protein